MGLGTSCKLLAHLVVEDVLLAKVQAIFGEEGKAFLFHLFDVISRRHIFRRHIFTIKKAFIEKAFLCDRRRERGQRHVQDLFNQFTRPRHVILLFVTLAENFLYAVSMLRFVIGFTAAKKGM